MMNQTNAQAGRIPSEICIPEALRKLNNWVAWKLESRNGKHTKVPYSSSGRRASSADRNTWSPLAVIAEMLSADGGGQYEGFGLMIDDGLVFIDVDHCTGYNKHIDERGQDVLSAFPYSYAEISQSGQGLHILTRGKIPRSFNNRTAGIEMYAASRFCAYTGNAIQAFDPAEDQAGIDYVFNKYCTRTSKTNKNDPHYSGTKRGKSLNTDQWVIDHASKIKGERGRNFQALFDGDTSAYKSASEADQALCTLLAFWCDRDVSQIDRIFRQSKLHRPKWEREDYRNRTIAHACERIPESLRDYQRRMDREKARAIAEER